MSWSVSLIGKQASVKTAAVAAFNAAAENVKNIAEEVATVRAVETVFQHQLAFLSDIEGIVVKMSASGSCYKSTGVKTTGQTGVTLSFETLYGFVE